MCIIVYKPAGVAMPSNEILTNCEEANDDGIGAMWIDEEGVGVYKEYTKLETFLEKLPKNDWTALPLAIHFRWATHGKACDALCHPFSISEDYEELLKVSGRVKAGFMHNGILPVNVKDSRLSDTAVFVQDHLAKFLDRIDALSDVDSSLIEFVMGSDKGVLFTDTGRIYTFGKFIEDDGIYYSNTGYLSSPAWKYSRFDSTSFKRGSSFVTGKTDTFDYSDYFDDSLDDANYGNSLKTRVPASNSNLFESIEQCAHCSRYYDIESMFMGESYGEYLCENCLDEHEDMWGCSTCGRMVSESKIIEVDGALYCEDCLMECEVCGLPVPAQKLIALQEESGTDTSTTYCCQDCGQWLERLEKEDQEDDIKVAGSSK